MDFFLNNWILIAMAFVTGAMLVWPAVNNAPRSGAVSVTEAVNLINREKAVIVDVSEPGEFSKEHAGGAKHVAFGDVETKLADQVKLKTKPILLMCPTGARANKAVASAKKAGFEQVKFVQGGTAAWRAAGMPIESGAA
jgi:rhodanese-related sulfurtransferase